MAEILRFEAETSEACRVSLTFEEMELGASAGVRRRIRKIEGGRTDLISTPDGFQKDIDGALAELAFAKRFGLHWSGLGVRGAADVGENFEVRASMSITASMIVRHHNPDDSRFVLAIGGSRDFEFVGWLYGRECKRAEWLRRPNEENAAFFVPQDALRPIGELVT